MSRVLDHVVAAEGLVQEVRTRRAAIPLAEQNTWAFQQLDLVVGSGDPSDGNTVMSGRSGLLTSTLSQWAEGMDVEALVFLAQAQLAEEAAKELRQAVEGIAETNNARRQLRESVNALRQEEEKIDSAMREAYEQADRSMAAAQTSMVMGIAESMRMVAPVGAAQDEENEVTYTVDVNVGGSVTATLDCGNGPNDPSAATVRLINVMSGKVEAEGKSALGPATATAQLQDGVPAALRVQMRAGASQVLGIRLCVLQVQYSKRVRPLTVVAPAEKKAFEALVAPRAQAILDLRDAVSKAMAAQLPSDDFKALSGFLSRTLRDLNRSAEAMTLADVKQAKQELRDQKDSISEMGETDMLLLQQAMEKKQQLEQMISNVMRAVQETGQSAVQALKAS
jgi:hypothetical protein